MPHNTMTFQQQQSLWQQLVNAFWFWVTIGIAMLVIGLIGYGMGKADTNMGSNQRGAVDNSAPERTG